MPAILSDLPLWAYIAAFAVGAVAVWRAGWRLARQVDALTTRTGLGRAFAGMLFLGGITSLPEVAAVSTSAAIGNAPLALNNLLGTASINVALLAFADVIYGREALTRAAAKPAILMQGVLMMLLMAAVALLATAGDVDLGGVGAGAALLGVGALAALRLASGFEQRHVWEVAGKTPGEQPRDDAGGDARPLAALWGAVAGSAAIILAGGVLLSTSADAIAGTLGIQSGLVGFLLIGFATSLPELSSITAAVRIGRYRMAVGDIFGTNLFNIMLILLADVVYRGGPVLSAAGRFEAVGAALAIVMTGIFLVGLLERANRTILRMGYDSLAAILVFLAGVALLFRIA